MKLYIMRHGETDWNKEKRLQGRSDIDINENGILLAEKTSKAMEDIPFTHIFSSPLIRACHTAEIMKGNREISIVKDERLLEMSFGDQEGLPPEKVDKDFHFFFDAPEKYKAPKGGESYEEAIKRTSSFLEEVIVPLSEKEPDAHVLILGHGAMNKTLITYLTGAGIKDMWSGPFQKNCCVNIFEIKGHTFEMLENAKIYY